MLECLTFERGEKLFGMNKSQTSNFFFKSLFQRSPDRHARSVSQGLHRLLATLSSAAPLPCVTLGKSLTDMICSRLDEPGAVQGPSRESDLLGMCYPEGMETV